MRFSLGPSQNSTSVVKDVEEVQHINSNYATGLFLPENIIKNQGFPDLLRVYRNRPVT